jgi:hypothetical protein
LYVDGGNFVSLLLLFVLVDDNADESFSIILNGGMIKYS